MRIQITYLKYLPIEFKEKAIQLFFSSLKDKLEPVLGNQNKAQETLLNNLAMNRCLSAVCDQRLVGILGFRTAHDGFIGPTLEHMIKVYGIVGGVSGMCGLAMLNHKTSSDEIYIDGIAVAEEKRGKGIGSNLINLLERIATEKGIRKVSLEVIDSNPRALSLYRRLGFIEVEQQTIWPVNLFYKFPFRSTTLMVKKVGIISNSN